MLYVDIFVQFRFWYFLPNPYLRAWYRRNAGVETLAAAAAGAGRAADHVAALDARHARADRARAALAGATRLGPDRAAAVESCVEINQ